MYVLWATWLECRINISVCLSTTLTRNAFGQQQKRPVICDTILKLSFFKKIQDWILKSENGFCVSFLNKLIKVLSDQGASKKPKNPLWARILRFL